MKNNQVDMLSGSITKGLLSMTIPLMIMNVMTNMFSIIDMTVLGRFTNDTAVGAVGACGMLITLCNGLFIGCSAGSNVVVARHIGEGDQKKTDEAAGTTILFAILGGTLKGMGKPVIPSVATFLFMCLFRFVWVYGIFPLCTNLTFLYLVWPVGWILCIITLLAAYFPAMKKLENKLNAVLITQFIKNITFIIAYFR